MSRSRTLLIITTTFYPHRVVGGVRMTQWCRHLSEFGWKPVVLTRYYGAYATPEELAIDVHPDVELHYFNPPSPSRPSPEDVPGRSSHAWKQWLKSLAAATVGQLMVPDVSLTYWRSARGKALELLDQVRPEAVLTSGPPHSNHDVGRWLAEVRPEVPWVADFRDPYLIDARYQPRGLGRLLAPFHRNYERAIYDQAALITHAIPFQARWARIRYPADRQKIKILTNGCPTDLAEGRLQPIPSHHGVRSIRVMGATDPTQREALVRAVESLIAEGSSVELRLIGSRRPDEEKFSTRLGPRFVATGQLAHHDAMRQILGADVLVNAVTPKRSHVLGISSKLFEFLACGKPIVVINPTRTDRQILRSMQGVRLLSNPGPSELGEAFRWALTLAAVPPAEQTLRVCHEFSRRNQTERLATWLNELISGRK